MDEYLIDRETLGKFVDELLKKKPSPAKSAEELDKIREHHVAALDEKIGMKIFGKLNDSQLDELNTIMDDKDSPEEYQTFFSRVGVDLEQTISDAMQDYANEFLGGTQNG